MYPINLHHHVPALLSQTFAERMQELKKQGIPFLMGVVDRTNTMFDALQAQIAGVKNVEDASVYIALPNDKNLKPLGLTFGEIPSFSKKRGKLKLGKQFLRSRDYKTAKLFLKLASRDWTIVDHNRMLGVAKELASSFNPMGRLTKNEKGFVYLKVDNLFAAVLYKMLKPHGFKKPPFYSENSAGAHATVIKRNEVQGKPLNLRYLYDPLYFEILDFQIVSPPNWKGVDKAAIVTLRSKTLEKTRTDNNLSPLPNDLPFHITVGIIHK